MRNLLIKKLLKSKLDESKTVEELIEKYLNEVKKVNKQEAEKFLADLLVSIKNQIEDVEVEDIISMVETKLSGLGYSIDMKKAEELYSKMATMEAVTLGTSFKFTNNDAKTVNALNRSMVWLKNDGSEKTKEKVNSVIEEAFKGNIKTVEVASALKDKFSGIVDDSVRYFEGVSDHLIRQSQSLAKVERWVSSGIEKAKVVAVMDKQTSSFCRAINGRIIEVSHLNRQANMIRNAKNIDEKKDATPWQKEPIFGKLPANVGMPPYHFRCRTTIIAFFSETVKIDGKNVNGSIAPEAKYKENKKVIFSHVDNMGYERVVTDKTLEHGGISKKPPLKDIIAGLNSLESIGFHNLESNRIVAYSRDKKLFYSFGGDEVITVFGASEDYFKRSVDKDFIFSRSVKKGEDNV